MAKLFKVATRSSPLAMKQTQMAIDYLAGKIEGADFEVLDFKTTGDKKLNWSLEKHGGKGLFTKELEDSLLSGETDFAVHSAKDLSVDIPEGLALAAFLPRDDPRDTLILRESVSVPSLIATASPRRRSQLKKMFPTAVWTEIRGNIETRLRKISESAADASVLAAAGLDRLGIETFEGLEFKRLKVQCCVPAVGQGAIAIECRRSDLEFFSSFSDKPTELAVLLEREFLKALGGGCQVAYGAYFDGELLHFYHEKVGYQKLDLSGFADFDQKANAIRELAEGLI